MPKKGDPPSQALFDFVERLQPSAKAITKAFGLDRITPDLVAKMQGFPNAKALDEFLKRMRAQDEQLQTLLKNAVPPLFSGAKSIIQLPTPSEVTPVVEAKPAEAPKIASTEGLESTSADATQLEFPPSALCSSTLGKRRRSCRIVVPLVQSYRGRRSGGQVFVGGLSLPIRCCRRRHCCSGPHPSVVGSAADAAVAGVLGAEEATDAA